MKILISKKIYLIVFCSLLIGNVCFSQDVSVLESSTEIIKKIEGLWKDSDMDGLETYLEKLYKSDPKYVPAIIGSSFLDYIYRGKLESAKEKLCAINKLIDMNPDSWDKKFIQNLDLAIKEIDMETRLHKKHGTTEAQLKKNASPKKYREIAGSKLPPRLEMIRYCPSP